MQYVWFLLQCDCNYKLAASKMWECQSGKKGRSYRGTNCSWCCMQSQCSCDPWYWVEQAHLDFIICSLGTQPGFKRVVDCQVFFIILSFTPCQVTVLSIPAIVKTCIAVRSEEFRSGRNEKSCQSCLKPWSRTACKKVNRRTLTREVRHRWRMPNCIFGQRDKVCAVSLLRLSRFVMSYISLNDPTLTSWKGTNFLLSWWRQQGFNNKSITLLDMFTGKKAIDPINCINQTVCLNVLTGFNLLSACTVQ